MAQRKPYVSKPSAERLVCDATLEYDEGGELHPRGPYLQLSDLANATDARGRAILAAAIYLHGSPALRGSRAHDNCFENYDGGEVVAELVRQAEADPRLHGAIAADFGGTFPAQWEQTRRDQERMTDSQRQLIALRLASPKRAEAGRTIAAQADAAHLPLFIAANEPGLFA